MYVEKITQNLDVLGDDDKQLIKEYDYDQFDRVTQMDYTVDTQQIEKYVYSYDKNSNILTKNEEKTKDENTKTSLTTYTYDNNRLKTSTKSNPLSDESSLTSYSYDIVVNKVEEVCDGKTSSYTYNGLNQLTTVTGSALSISYTYEGQRVRRTSNGTTTYYRYQNDMLLEKTDETGVSKAFYLYGANSNVQGFESAGQYYTYAKDIQSSVSSVVDRTGSVVLNYEYDDYGEMTCSGNTSLNNDLAYTRRLAMKKIIKVCIMIMLIVGIAKVEDVHAYVQSSTNRNESKSFKKIANKVTQIDAGYNIIYKRCNNAYTIGAISRRVFEFGEEEHDILEPLQIGKSIDNIYSSDDLVAYTSGKSIYFCGQGYTGEFYDNYDYYYSPIRFVPTNNPPNVKKLQLSCGNLLYAYKNNLFLSGWLVNPPDQSAHFKAKCILKKAQSQILWDDGFLT